MSYKPYIRSRTVQEVLTKLGESKRVGQVRLLVPNAKVKCACGTSLTEFDMKMHNCEPDGILRHDLLSEHAPGSFTK